MSSNSICQTLIEFNPKIILNGSKLTKMLLLSHCSRLTDICLKELASQKEMVGLNMSRANVEAIAKILFQGDILSPGIFLIDCFIVRNPGEPCQLSCWKEKGITQEGIKGMRVRDPKEAVWVILPIHNDVLRASDTIIITNDNSSNLICSGFRKIIAPLVTILIKVKRDCALLIRGHTDSQIKSLLIKGYSRMNLKKNTLK